MGLTLPVEAGEEEIPLWDDEETLEEIANRLDKAEKESRIRKIRGVVQAPDGESFGEEEEYIKELTAALHRDFGGTALRKDVPPEFIVVRGPLCEGKIEIKPGHQPKKQRPIHLNGERREALIELIKESERRGKMEDGIGEWSSPAFVVAKKGSSKWRLVVDYRALNEATAADGYPLPRINDILVQYGRKAIFSVMDLKDAFHQVPLHKDSRPYTCTSTPLGTKQWKVVVMGLKNGVAIFQRVVEYCLREVRDVASPYVDDILTGTDKQNTLRDIIDQHDKDLRTVLIKMQVDQVVGDIDKRNFFRPEV